MKTEMNAQPSEENKMNDNQKPAPRLSDQAFYLIALTNLLKKEFDLDSFEKIMAPIRLTDYPGNAA